MSENLLDIIQLAYKSNPDDTEYHLRQHLSFLYKKLGALGEFEHSFCHDCEILERQSEIDRLEMMLSQLRASR